MLLEQVYLAFIYILFIELAMVTVVAIALLIALVVTIRKDGRFVLPELDCLNSKNLI